MGRLSLSKNLPAEGFGGKESVKGNRHTEPQRGVSERNRRNAAALGAEMGFLSRSITRRSGQNCKIIQFHILQFCSQLVKKVQRDFFDKLNRPIGFSRWDDFCLLKLDQSLYISTSLSRCS